jgi:Mrp family chromosome partitioning ATPase
LNNVNAFAIHKSTLFLPVVEDPFNYIEKRRKLMRIIAVANQKGGCGKTTTAINLSSALVAKGQKILLIDCDPQAHATMGLNVKPSDLESSMYNVNPLTLKAACTM